MLAASAGLVAHAADAQDAARPAAAAAFRDPLDVPAAPSRIAALAPMMAVTRTPDDRLVAVGRRGLVLTSTDGTAWSQSKVPVATDLVAVHFPTPQQGWAVGHGGVVLHSDDGGASWRKQLDGRQLPALLVAHYKPLADAGDSSAQQALQDAERLAEDGPGRPLLAVWFADAREGYAVGAFNLALRTQDGGATWQVIGDRIDNPQAMHLYAVTRIGDALWVAGEQGLLLRAPFTSGEAARFTRVEAPYPGTFFGVAGQGDTLVAFGLRGNAALSRDGGTRWQMLKLPTQSSLTGGAVEADGRIVLTSLSGELLVSNAEATAFEHRRLSPPMALYGVAAAGAGRVAIAGARGARVAPLQPDATTAGQPAPAAR